MGMYDYLPDYSKPSFGLTPQQLATIGLDPDTGLSEPAQPYQGYVTNGSGQVTVNPATKDLFPNIPPAGTVVRNSATAGTVSTPSTLAGIMGKDPNSLSDQDVNFYLNFLKDPTGAAQNLMRMSGYNQFNPYSRMMSSSLSNSARLLDMLGVLRGGVEPDMRQLLQQITSQSGSRGAAGIAELGTQGGAANVMGQLNSLVRQVSQPEGAPDAITTLQKGLASIFAPGENGNYTSEGINNIADLIMGIQGQTMSPMFQNLYRNVLPSVAGEFRLKSPFNKGKTLLDMLTGSMNI